VAVCRLPAQERVRSREGQPGARHRRVRAQYAALSSDLRALHDRGLPASQVDREHRDLPVHVRRRLAVDHVVGGRLLSAAQARVRRAQGVDATASPEHRVHPERPGEADRAVRRERLHDAVPGREDDLDDQPAGKARHCRLEADRCPGRRRPPRDRSRESPRGKIEVSIVSASGEALAHSALGHDDFLQNRPD